MDLFTANENERMQRLGAAMPSALTRHTEASGGSSKDKRRNEAQRRRSTTKSSRW